MAVNPLKINHALADLQLQKWITMWKALVRSDRQLTEQMIAGELNLNHTTVHQILTQELAMRKLLQRWFPKT